MQDGFSIRRIRRITIRPTTLSLGGRLPQGAGLSGLMHGPALMADTILDGLPKEPLKLFIIGAFTGTPRQVVLSVGELLLLDLS